MPMWNYQSWNLHFLKSDISTFFVKDEANCDPHSKKMLLQFQQRHLSIATLNNNRCGAWGNCFLLCQKQMASRYSIYQFLLVLCFLCIPSISSNPVLYYIVQVDNTKSDLTPTGIFICMYLEVIFGQLGFLKIPKVGLSSTIGSNRHEPFFVTE